MIAPELVNTLRRLNREEKLEVIRLLQDEFADESSEWDSALSEPGRVFRIPSVRVNFNEAGSFFDSLEVKPKDND